MRRGNFFTLGTVFCLVWFIGGCKKSSDPITADASGSSAVNLSVGFAKVNSSFAKINTADSLRIDSVIVVLQRIKFESSIDTVKLDSTGTDTTETEKEMEVTFKGPFVVHVRDTSSVDFANQVLPAGTYNGIKFKIHRLQPGEKHEDSDEHNHHAMQPNDSSFQNHSIVIWGSVKQNGIWILFKKSFDIEVEFKLKGTFTVTSSTSTIKMALRFNTGDWFKDIKTGALLDPTDPNALKGIEKAIEKSFENGKGGKDSNGDGHPDD
ncbi:MAG: hypothetical protein PHP42_13425 [Bacteroidota bacterium]|nr:hypothetical protein [Bacteroidota bacterium]